jgi:hypothetical protein
LVAIYGRIYFKTEGPEVLRRSVKSLDKFIDGHIQ